VFNDVDKPCAEKEGAMRSKAYSLRCPLPHIFILALILFPTSAFSATIHVPTDQPTIQAGIDAASDGDTVLAADGTYTGAGNKNLDFKGKAITVRSKNGPEKTIVDCEGDGRGFYFHTGEQQDSVVSGFTVKNGRGILEGPGLFNHGGGIFCENSSPTIDDCIITENSSDYGFGISITGGSPSISNCTITGNYSIASIGIGGGIYLAETSALINNCTITGNQEGGIYSQGGSPTVINCTITGNWVSGTPSYGGGISSYNSSILISDCLVKNNSGGFGGGISFRGGSPSITRSSIIENYSTLIKSSGGGGGGGIYCGSDLYFDPTNAIISNCVISGNTAGHGGGISCDDGSATIINSTISGNSASQSSSGAVYTNSSTNIINSILWSNSPDEIYADNSNPIAKYSLIKGGWGDIGNIDLNPAFVDPTIGDYRLKNYSPCIGAGTPMGASNTDIEGNPIPNPPDSNPDMGAHENSRATRAIPLLNIFAIEVGNSWNYEGTKQGNPSTVEREVIRLDQTTFSPDTYVFDIKVNEAVQPGEWYEKKPSEIRLWAADGYQFAAGLLAAWYPMQVGDHRESSANVVGFPGASVRLIVDVLSKGPLALAFDTLEAYELRYQSDTSGPGGNVTEIFRLWMVPYIGVVKDQRADSLVKLTSFAIGGNTLSEDTDADSDGLKDYQELIIYETSLVDADTDIDGMPDGWEVTYKLDPLDEQDANEDNDQDGYTNLEEYQKDTDPNDPKSHPSKAMPWIPLLLDD